MIEPQLANTNLLLRPEEAGRLLSIGRTQVYALMASGELASVQIGRLRRVPYASCQRYVERLQELQKLSSRS